MSLFKKGDKPEELKTKGMGIKMKLIVSILPVVFVLLILLTVITTFVSQSIILGRANSEMSATLKQYSNEIAGDLDVIRSQADELSLFIAATHDSVSIDEYKNALCAVVVNNDMILGSGIWFEPNVYDKSEKYYGPYWYKNVVDGKWDGADLIETWDYSNADYNYFNQEYYLNAKNMQSASITDPYYDETSGLVMTTCSAPIRDRGGNYLGCVTVDVMLSSMNETLASIRVGETGTVWLLDSAGIYIYHPALDTSKEAISITSSTELGEYISAIQTKDAGKGDFKWEAQTRLLYWDTIPGMNWKMGLTITRAELFRQIWQLIYISFIICIVAMVACSVIIIIRARDISSSINCVAKSLVKLSNGEFVIIDDEKELKKKDEFGLIVESMNNVIDKLNNIVHNIVESSNSVAVSATELSDMTNQISQTTDDVSNAVQEIASGATQQADEIQTAVTATDTVSSSISEIKSASNDISKSAEEMEIASKATSESIDNLRKSSEETSVNIEAISEAILATKEAVDNIKEKVEGITNIATQTNLLSLNASIEAARAGDAGKGFAVVAQEIGKLAEDSKTMADDIKNQMEVLLEKSDSAVGAVNSVKDSNADTQTALGESLESINKMIEEIDNTVKGIEEISVDTDNSIKAKDSVVDTMSALSAISEENAASAEETGASMEELNATVTTLNEAASNLNSIADKLNTEMQFFKI